ncbi:MAG: arginine repressor [bacterium]
MMHEHTKTHRQQLLQKIIEEHGAGDQNRLLNELKKQGVDTTQVTVSRDLQEMGFVKVRVSPGVYEYKMLEKPSPVLLWDRLRILFHNFVKDVKSTGNLILIKTSPGNANGVASLLDGLERKEILGTIAGDDTILVVVDSEKNRKNVENDLRSLL